MDPKQIRLIKIIGLMLLGMWVATPIVLFNVFDCATDRGTFGDLYGSVNSLFSGMALLGVIAAIILQHKELSLSTQELRNSAAALQKQVELSADTARLQVLPGLLQAQKIRIETLGQGRFDGFSKQDYSIQILRKRIELCHKEINDGPNDINSLTQKLKEEAFRELYRAAFENEIYYKIDQIKQTTVIYLQIIPELELLISYMNDLSEIYQKIKDTKF